MSLNVYDTILTMQQRQAWLRDHLADNGFEPLPFVGKYRGESNAEAIARDIHETLRLPANWAAQHSTWEDALRALIDHIEDIGIFTAFSGVVGQNNHRPIPVEECRGFVLVDPIAPLLFVNNGDAKAAQLFTIAHELAHIWIGRSAGFDFRQLTPANDPAERQCDRVAAEFLVPTEAFRAAWGKTPSIRETARTFRVSEIVAARRALDLGVMAKSDFLTFYAGYIQRARGKPKGKGGDFHRTATKRLGLAFLTHIRNAVKSGQLLYRDAYQLTGLRGETFQRHIASIP